MPVPTIHRRVPVTVIWGTDAAVGRMLDNADVSRDPGVGVIGSASHVTGLGPRTSRPPLTGERTPGCRCCRSRIDLISTIHDTLERPGAPRHLIVALNPDDDLLVIVRTLLAEPDLESIIDLDAVVALLHGPALATRRSRRAPLADDTLLEVLAVADRVIVSDTSAVVDLARIGIERSLRPLVQVGRLVMTDEPRFDRGLLHAWHGVPPQQQVQHRAAHPPDEGTGAPRALRCSIDASVDPGHFDQWLSDTIGTYGQRLYRTQGSIHVLGRSSPVCLRGVLSHAATHPSTERPPHRQQARSTFVLVGQGLDDEALAAGFRSTAAA